MINLSLAQCAKTNLSNVPITDGQIVFCTDTGEFYRDVSSTRVPMALIVDSVSSLPLAPITYKLYFVSPDLYVFNGEDWIQITESSIAVADSVSAFGTGDTGKLYVDKSTNKTYRFDGKEFVLISEYDDTAVKAGIKSNADAITNHKNDTNNPHNVTKSQVGLGNVVNLDQSKAISTIKFTEDSLTIYHLDGTSEQLDQRVGKLACTDVYTDADGVAYQDADGVEYAGDTVITARDIIERLNQLEDAVAKLQA